MCKTISDLRCPVKPFITDLRNKWIRKNILMNKEGLSVTLYANVISGMRIM